MIITREMLTSSSKPQLVDVNTCVKLNVNVQYVQISDIHLQFDLLLFTHTHNVAHPKNHYAIFQFFCSFRCKHNIIHSYLSLWHVWINFKIKTESNCMHAVIFLNMTFR